MKNLLGTASRHYANGEYAKAEELLTEIIRIDPTIRQSWFTLATIYEERGNMEKSFMFKIVATHLSSARSASSDWNHLGIQSRYALSLPHSLSSERELTCWPGTSG